MLNRWQCAKQIEYLLKSLTWPDSPSESVFGTRVAVTAQRSGHVGGLAGATVPPAEAFLSERTGPFAIVRAADSVPQGRGPEIARFSVEAFVRGLGTTQMRNSVVGGSRGASGAGSSTGRGALELEEVVRSRFNWVTASDYGIQARVVAASTVRAFEAQPEWSVIPLELEVHNVVADRYYDPPYRLLATGGSGQVVLAWSLPPDRFDRLSVILRRAAGATAPTTVAGGTGVTLASALATTKTDTVAAGTYSYSLFAAYDETNSTPTTADRYSAAATFTSVVAT